VLKKRADYHPRELEMASVEDDSRIEYYADDNGNQGEYEPDNQPKKPKRTKESAKSKSIDLTKVQRNATRKDKEKRVFRKEVEARRTVVEKEERHDINRKVC
jgi:hypothetical protein